MNESEIFKVAADLPPERRSAYLDDVCGGDSKKRDEIESLLRADGEADDFLEQPAAAIGETETYRPITEGPGSVIGRYRLVEQIGEGGFGLVFVAEQQSPVRRKVALKINKPGMDTKEVIARFEAERQALALMDHPNIAKVLDAGTTESGRPYFVMELIRGIPILKYCDEKKLATQQRLELFLSVCRAVQHAHSKGIIHRDLKPSNVLVSPHDGVPMVKVIDFGIAKAIGQQLTDRTIYTRLTQMIGTPLYMSPEQAEINALDVDIRSDVYSLGVVLYELLTGTTPFDRERFATAAYEEIKRIIREEEPPTPSRRLSTLGDTATKISQQRETDPSRLAAMLRGELDWIVMRCLEKERTRRYQTASELGSDLQRYLDNEPVEAVPPSRLYRAKKLARRYRVPLTIFASYVVLSLCAIFAIHHQAQIAKDMTQSLQGEFLDKAVNEACNGNLDDAMKVIDQLEKLPTPILPEFTDTLRAIAYKTAGLDSRAIPALEKLAEDSRNTLARLVLVWAYYRAGDIESAEDLYGTIAGEELQQSDIAPDINSAFKDLCKIFRSYSLMFESDVANDEAINILNDVLKRRRYWGIAYAMRADAHGVRLGRTKRIEDLKRAINDDSVATTLLPDSLFAKSNSLAIHVCAYQFADAFPDEVSEHDKRAWVQRGEKLAGEFAVAMPDWNAASWALSYYRATGNQTAADELEKQMEATYAYLPAIRDWQWYKKRNLAAFEQTLPDADSYTRFPYSILVLESGNRERAYEVFDEACALCDDHWDEVSFAAETALLMSQPERSEALARDCLATEEPRGTWIWMRKSLQFFAGELPKKDFLEQAEPFSEMLCVANHFVGVSHLARGERKMARQHFNIVMQTGMTGWRSYEAVKAYLARMDEDPDWPHWVPKLETD